MKNKTRFVPNSTIDRIHHISFSTISKFWIEYEIKQSGVVFKTEQDFKIAVQLSLNADLWGTRLH